MYKKILVILHDSILPHMSKPTLMIDFLTAAYEVGKFTVLISHLVSGMYCFFMGDAGDHGAEFCYGFAEQVALSACWPSMAFLSSYINITCEYYMKKKLICPLLIFTLITVICRRNVNTK